MTLLFSHHQTTHCVTPASCWSPVISFSSSCLASRSSCSPLMISRCVFQGQGCERVCLCVWLCTHVSLLSLCHVISGLFLFISVTNDCPLWGLQEITGSNYQKITGSLLRLIYLDCRKCICVFYLKNSLRYHWKYRLELQSNPVRVWCERDSEFLLSASVSRVKTAPECRPQPFCIVDIIHSQWHCKTDWEEWCGPNNSAVLH